MTKTGPVSLEEVVELYNAKVAEIKQLKKENKELKQMLKQQSDGFVLNHTCYPFENNKDELYVKDKNTRIELKKGKLWITVFIPDTEEIMTFNYYVHGRNLIKEYINLKEEMKQ